MKKSYCAATTEFVMFGNQDMISTSECWTHCDDEDCDFDCPENCPCHYCVGVCTWDCKVDDSTCTTGDYN